ncbi:pilus assembly protein [Thioalkalivibrio sp. ALE17]|uniref:pilus assembly protein n=1 Tax=Thioalkalivibrio sp. ALE17 TaxID=1158173 RepID=UPI000424D85E|nr:PilC/PilY family type IV pilus protein [Thioalkalivibrio sp. ALE17]
MNNVTSNQSRVTVTGTRRVAPLATMFGCAALAFSGTAHGLNIADAPLFLSSPVDPNLMFILDDSGSMHWDILPDESIYSYFTFPRPSGVYGSSDYPNYVVTFEDTIYAAFLRSPSTNPQYYDPSVTYRPWSNSDGSIMDPSPIDAAPHNPMLPGLGSRDLTSDNTESAGWDDCSVSDAGEFSGCSFDSESRTFFPAVYYRHLGGSVGDLSNYERVEIRSSTGVYSGEGREDRTDCANATAGSCSYAEEIQNFANWYTYHRSRVLTSRGAIGRAFADQGETFRVGYGTINAGTSEVDGVNTNRIIRGVRAFTGDDRAAWFDLLYERPIPAAGTPLRTALQSAGEYFSRNDSQGPWSTTPGDSGGEDLECRQSYTILMSDGYWNGASPGVGNVDGSPGPTIESPSGETFQYQPEPPFEDSYSNTLADVAMHYWKRDLRTDLENRVPTTSTNPAFWQHMVTFTVGLGVSGDIDPDGAFAAIATEDEIDWPNPTSSDAAKIDDMLHAAVNSRGGFFSTNNPDIFAEELSGVLGAITSRSGASVTSVATNSTELQPDGTNVVYQARFNSADWSGDIQALEIDVVSLDLVESWSAASQLPGHASRNIVTYDGSDGIEFDWNAISTLGSPLTEELVAYLRGDPSNELQNGGSFRNRSTPLGDIVNSNPVYQGASLNFGYGFEDDYMAFRQANQNRSEVVYVGSNGGMLHAFDAETGEELFAYVPSMLFDKLPQLADPNYTHKFFVDGQQRIAHAQIDGSWRTVLIGTLGAGGRGVYALDVTDPENFGPDNVLWELSGDDDADLGFTFGDATIGRTANDEWAVLFANGYGSNNEDAVLFVVDLEDGSITRKISTETAGGNGLSSPVFRASGDRIIQEGFAGDLQGNLWKFDLTSTNNTGQWDVAFKQGNNKFPLFEATSPNGSAQPITAKPAIGSHPNGGSIVLFGTGKFFETQDNQIESDPQIQTVYGVRDHSETDAPLGRDDLVPQSFIGQGVIAGTVVRATSDEELDEDADGWRLDLDFPEPRGERVVTQPVLIDGRVEFVTLIPFDDPCAGGGTSALFSLNAATGGRPSNPVFDLNRDGDFDSGDTITINGEEVAPSSIDPGLGIIGRPTLIRNPADGRLYRVISGTEGEGIEEAPLAVQLQPRSWLQLR